MGHLSTKEVRRSIYNDIKSGDKSIQDSIDEQPEEIAFIEKVAKFAKPSETEVKVLFLYGTTGCGKTFSMHKVLTAAGIPYYKKPPGNKWFDGYTGQSVMVLEEFRSCLNLSTFLGLTDINPPPLEIKGGYMPMRATHIICISNKSPDEQYENVTGPCKEAYFRRITMTCDCGPCAHEEIEAYMRNSITNSCEH